ncbi:MAG TPA: recombinase [Desulfosporosinus sp.]|nr:recombinase [Desulfosporosinus sp.]
MRRKLFNALVEKIEILTAHFVFELKRRMRVEEGGE